MKNRLAISRDESIKLGNQFLKLDLIQSLNKNQLFLDDPKAYYTFAVSLVCLFFI